MKTILKNATIVKLREYSRAYGKPETITSAYLFETDKHITTVDEIGREVRTFRKGTRLLISFSGDTISGDDFIREVEEAKEKAAIAGTRASGSSGVARRQDGAIALITTNKTARASGTSFTETEFNDIIKGIYDGGTDSTVDLVLLLS